MLLPGLFANAAAVAAAAAAATAACCRCCCWLFLLSVSQASAAGTFTAQVEAFKSCYKPLRFHTADTLQEHLSTLGKSIYAAGSAAGLEVQRLAAAGPLTGASARDHCEILKVAHKVLSSSNFTAEGVDVVGALCKTKEGIITDMTSTTRQAISSTCSVFWPTGSVDPEAMPKLIAEGMTRMNSNTTRLSDLVSLLLPIGEGDPHMAIVID